MVMPNDQFFIAQSGRSAWKWLVTTFILGWFSGIAPIAVSSIGDWSCARQQMVVLDNRSSTIQRHGWAAIIAAIVANDF